MKNAISFTPCFGYEKYKSLAFVVYKYGNPAHFKLKSHTFYKPGMQYYKTDLPTT